MSTLSPDFAQPQLEFVDCPHPEGHHRMAYWRWGDAGAAHVVVCVHGLTRQGRDFDRLAQALLLQRPQGLQVICPDVVGRGRSDWLSTPDAYQLPQYAADMLAMLAQVQAGLGAHKPMQVLDWVGTSMGGLIGMALAGQPGLPLPVPIRRLVLNEVGPVINWSSVQRMQAYVGQFGQYRNLDEVAAVLRLLSQGFGPVPAALWREMSKHMTRPGPDGALTLHYDPAIGVNLRAMTPEIASAGEAALWALYDQIRAQTLLIRGEDSDLLTPETATAMTVRGPRALLQTWPGFGHAPTLTGDDQTAAVSRFLLDV
ncbi:MAG: alpha/beta hydrolase [Limnohabitans sp.]|jgi:pimeloyl-ACP methyl ester carboxylesterase|uniref:alpha/beta fold hydrolase n=1 Tax=Limnohabitans sp. TaxID=1907725 RepID=UPI0025F9C4FE|nr:alpha/beta hydrolase [Limnohabitans sp.]MCO4088377.1 alpha/beta hydrolase [Limnohabitans sp.]